MKPFITFFFSVSILASLLGFSADAAANQSTVTQHAAHHTHSSVHAKIATGPVDINHANASQLTSLKGIGPSKAQAITAYRQAHGSFQTVNDLTKVKGIGAKTLARLEAKNPGRIVVNIDKNIR